MSGARELIAGGYDETPADGEGQAEIDHRNGTTRSDPILPHGLSRWNAAHGMTPSHVSGTAARIGDI